MEPWFLSVMIEEAGDANGLNMSGKGNILSRVMSREVGKPDASKVEPWQR